MSVPVRRQSEYGGVVFGGWARMAQTITSFSIVEVAKPNIGESWPARVRADVTVNLNVQDHIKHEWEGKLTCVRHLRLTFLVNIVIGLFVHLMRLHIEIQLHILYLLYFIQNGTSEWKVDKYINQKTKSRTHHNLHH